MTLYHVRYKQTVKWYDAYFETKVAAEAFIDEWPWLAEYKGQRDPK